MTVRTLVAAGLYLLPAVLFTEIARQLWIFRRVRHPQGQLFQVLPIATTVLAVHYGVLVARALVPGALSPGPMHEVLTPWHAEIEVSWLISLVLMRHVLRLTPLRRLHRAHSGSPGTTVSASAVPSRCSPSGCGRVESATQQLIGHRLFELSFAVVGLLCFAQLARTARPGAWGPESAGEMRGPDVRLVKIGIAVAFLVAPVVWLAGGGEFSMVVFEVFMGLVLAAPIATRMAAWVLAEGIVTLELFVATALLLAAYTYALPRSRPSSVRCSGRPR